MNCSLSRKPQKPSRSEVKDDVPDVAWRKIETLGNCLRHEYSDVDPELIWNITQDYLPNLLAAARRRAESLREGAPA